MQSSRAPSAHTESSARWSLSRVPGAEWLDPRLQVALGRTTLRAASEPVRSETALTASVSLPYERGTNRVEAICDLPPEFAGGKTSWLVLYDAPGADRREGEHIVFDDLLSHD